MRSSRAVLLALTALLVAARGSAETFYGTGIASLSFRGDAPVDERRLAALTELAPGRTLTGEAVRTSLRNLFATRLFSDLAVEASPSPAGSVVVVVFSAAPRIERLALSSSVPASGRVLDAVGLGPGNPWQSDLEPRYESEIRRVLRPDGRAIIYDLPDRWGRLETMAPPLAATAAAAGLDGSVAPFPWPGRLRLVRRLEAVPGGDSMPA